MTNDTDEKFYARADAHIQLANSHLADAAPGKASASMMFAASRFNAWISAKDFPSGAEMETKREEIIEYFTSQYRAMLTDNVNNYIEHFDAFMNPKGNS
jgi:hypothetical protein